MKYILYGTEISPPVRAVLLCFKALGLDWELRTIDLLAKEHLKEEFLKKNPQHTVPVLEIEDGKYIWDSHAINCYLVSRHAKNDSLYPKDFYLHAIVDQRLHFDSGILYPSLKSINYPLFYHNERDIPEWKYDCIRESYAMCEKFLEHWNYFCGNSLTIADLHFIATITSLEAYIPVHGDQYPRLFAWLKRMQALPYYNEANGVRVHKFIELVHQKMHGH